MLLLPDARRMELTVSRTQSGLLRGGGWEGGRQAGRQEVGTCIAVCLHLRDSQKDSLGEVLAAPKRAVQTHTLALTESQAPYTFPACNFCLVVSTSPSASRALRCCNCRPNITHPELQLVLPSSQLVAPPPPTHLPCMSTVAPVCASLRAVWRPIPSVLPVIRYTPEAPPPSPLLLLLLPLLPAKALHIHHYMTTLCFP